MIKVSVVGAKGRMGSHVVDAVDSAADTELALALDAGDDLTAITPENTDVVVEFTVPSVSLGNVLALVKQGVDVVVGTTGWTEEKLDRCAPRSPRPRVRARACSSRRTSPFPRCSPTISQRSRRRISNPRKSSNCTTRPRWTLRPAPLSTLRRASPKRARRPAWVRFRTPPKPMAAPAAGGGRHPRARRASAWPQRP